MSFEAQIRAAPFKPYSDTLRRTYHPCLYPFIRMEEEDLDTLSGKAPPGFTKTKADLKGFGDSEQASKTRGHADVVIQQEEEANQVSKGESSAVKELIKVPALFVLTTNAELKDLVKVSYMTYKVEQAPGWQQLLPQRQCALHQLKMIRQVTESALWGRPFLKVFAAALRSAIQNYKAPHPQIVQAVAAYFKNKVMTKNQEVLVAEILYQKGKASSKPVMLKTCPDQEEMAASTVPLTMTTTTGAKETSILEHTFVTVIAVEGGKWLVGSSSAQSLERDVKNLLAKLINKM